MIGLAVRRPVAAAMAYAGVALFGLVAWRNLPVELLPDTELPRIAVTASWPGASPETVEAFVTAPLEAMLQQVRGVESVQSVSEEGLARVSVGFGRDVDMRFAGLETSERLAALENDLPPGVQGPHVQAYVPEEFRGQSRALMRYTVTGPYTPEALGALVDTALAPALVALDGVAAVVAADGRPRLLEVELDDARVLALGLDPERVRATVSSLMLVRPVGTVEIGGMRRPAAIREGIASIESFLEAPVLADGRRVARLRDIAVVRDTYEPPASLYRVDGHPAITFEVVREAGSNALQVADTVRRSLVRLDPPLPAGVRLIVDEDQSQAIRAQLGDLRSRAGVAAVVIFLVVLLFLGSCRLAAIVCVTIAFSALTTLNLMYFAGMSLNMLTLMGLALGFGLIVDNAIVVLVSVHHHWLRGEPRPAAAESGAREVVLPVLASTATTVIVVVPFVYLQGEVRAYYVPLGVVVGISLIASLAVAFTLIPTVAASNLGAMPALRSMQRPRTAAVRSWRALSAAHARHVRPLPPVVRVYVAVVRGMVRRPWWPIGLVLLALASSWYVFDRDVPRGVAWPAWSNDGTYVSIEIALPPGADIARTDEYARAFEQRLRSIPEVGRFTTKVVPASVSIRVTFADSLAATSTPLIVEKQLAAFGHRVGGAEVRVHGSGASFHGGRAAPTGYAIEVLGYDYRPVQQIAEELATRLRGFPRVRDVDSNALGRWFERDHATEVVLRLDRSRLSMYGLSANDVVAYVGTAVGGNTRGDVIRVGGLERLLRVKLAGSGETDVLAFEQLLVPRSGGGAVRLGQLATLEEREVMSRITREDQQYRRLVSYQFRGPSRLGDRHQQAVIAATALPPGFTLGNGDGRRPDEEAMRHLRLVVAASLALVFMTTAALFESLRQPFVVLLTVPMALIGVFLIFVLAEASFTREAWIGVIMMGGIVVNNAILLVDHANRLAREQELAMRDAAVQSALDRARPILMTSATTVFGLLPLVLFSESADANIWNALGYALIGGLTSSTLLVLTVTPALLVLISPRR